MRPSLLVLALVGCCLAVSSVSAGSFADPDDAALMEIGVDLSAEARAVPTPTFTFDMPANSRAPLMAKFPLVHEIQGVEAQDWKDIQGLLTREPQVAEESSVDMKLDELEEQFNRIDAKSTAAPAAMPRMAQVGAAPAGAAKASAAANSRTPAPAAAAATPSPQTLAAAQAALAKLQAAVAATRPSVRSVPSVASVPAVAQKPTAQKPAAPAAASADSKKAAQTTARLIEKRLRGLTLLFKRFKAQTGMDKDDAAMARVNAALKKQKADAAALKKRLAKKGIVRFAQQGQDEDSAFVEAEAEAESEAEVENEVQSEAEVAADAEAIDDILDTLM